MPKFLVQASYTAEGTKGLLKTSGSARRAAVQEVVESLGGKVEAFYFTFGADDAVLIVDLPSTETALSLGFAVRASGTVHSKTTPLIPIEEIDRATKREVHWRPPGS